MTSSPEGRQEAAVLDATDPTCTDCGGTGVTYQTEHRCSCQPVPVAWQWRKTDRVMKHEDVWSYVDYHTGLKIKEHPEKYETRPLFSALIPAKPAVEVVEALTDRNAKLNAKLLDYYQTSEAIRVAEHGYYEKSLGLDGGWEITQRGGFSELEAEARHIDELTLRLIDLRAALQAPATPDAQTEVEK